MDNWFTKLYGFDRFRKHKETQKAIPSGPSHVEHTFGFSKFKMFSDTRTEEVFSIRGKELHVGHGDILVVPDGRINEIPERFRKSTIELPFSFGYAIIK